MKRQLKAKAEKYRKISRDVRARGVAVVDLGDRTQRIRSTQVAFLLDEMADTLELLVKGLE